MYTSTCIYHFSFNISFVFLSFWEAIASLPDSGIGVACLQNYFTHLVWEDTSFFQIKSSLDGLFSMSKPLIMSLGTFSYISFMQSPSFNFISQENPIHILFPSKRWEARCVLLTTKRLSVRVCHYGSPEICPVKNFFFLGVGVQSWGSPSNIHLAALWAWTFRSSLFFQCLGLFFLTS